MAQGCRCYLEPVDSPSPHCEYRRYSVRGHPSDYRSRSPSHGDHGDFENYPPSSLCSCRYQSPEHSATLFNHCSILQATSQLPPHKRETGTGLHLAAAPSQRTTVHPPRMHGSPSLVPGRGVTGPSLPHRSHLASWLPFCTGPLSCPYLLEEDKTAG